MDENEGLRQSILLLQNDELLRKTLIDLLQNEGYEVESIRSGQEAIDLVKKRYFNLVIADINLPGIDGIETAWTIKGIKSGVKTLLMLDNERLDKNALIRAIKAGVDDYIYKPFELEYFLHSVKRNLNVSKLEERLLEKTNELTLLFEIGREITSSLNLDEVLAIIVERTTDVLGVEMCSIMLLDESKGDLFIAAAKGLPQDVIMDTRIKKGERVSGWVFENKEALLVQDITKDHRFAKENEERYYTGSFVSVPLIFKGKTIGVINVNNKRSREVFNEEDLRLVEGIADHASIAIENARLYSNLEGVYLQVVATLTSIIELKDHYTKGHSDRVTQYAVALAEAMSLPYSEIEIIRLSCQLHDLGKIGIHENILTKPDKLTDEEWKEIKLHPLKGVEILRPLMFLKDEMRLVEQHHERYDGRGYPRGLKADDIDLRARIMAIADSFDAMTTNRPYARALTIEEAKEELKRNSGSQFDPKITEIFIQLLERNPDLFKKNH